MKVGDVVEVYDRLYNAWTKPWEVTSLDGRGWAVVRLRVDGQVYAKSRPRKVSVDDLRPVA